MAGPGRDLAWWAAGVGALLGAGLALVGTIIFLVAVGLIASTGPELLGGGGWVSPVDDYFWLSVLIGARRRAQSHDGDLILVSTGYNVAKVLELTGLNDVFEIHPTVEAARG